jgi:hypothetical protein
MQVLRGRIATVGINAGLVFGRFLFPTVYQDL